MSIENYDFAAWRKQLEAITGDEWSPGRCATQLHRSRSFYWKCEREGKADGAVVWAAYGVLRFHQDKLHEGARDAG